MPLVFGVSMGMDDAFMASMMDHPFWQRLCYLFGLGALSDGLAFLTLGLIRRWGEVWPSWVPRLRGRRIRPAVALVPAVLGGLLATALFTTMAFLRRGNMPDDITAWQVLMSAAYTPLLLWGPLVLAISAHYYRRRRHEPRPAPGRRTVTGATGPVPTS